MAATTLTLQEAKLAGLTPVYAAANADGSYFPNDGKVFLHLKNTDAGAVTATVTPTAKVAGLAPAAQTANVAGTSGDVMLGPFQPEAFNDAQGRCLVTFSAVTALTIAAIRVP